MTKKLKPLTDKSILKELLKRKTSSFKLEEFCFSKQLAFIQDPAKFKTATCSRRSGKTVGCAADLIHTAKTYPDTVSLYITLSRNNGKKIIWRELLKINKKFNLQAIPNETELSLTFPNSSMIYLSGAKDKTEIEKFRGLALKKVYIDEAQSFKAYLKELIDDILAPALYDYDGTLVLIGTPGPICAGTFYEANHGEGWAKHHWTILDNPHIKKKSGKEPEEILRQERERRGISETDPTYLRESLGQWVNDTNALVYKFDSTKNLYEELPEVDWTFIFGVDIGFEDADPIAVIAYSHTHDTAFLVEELVTTKQDISALAKQLQDLDVKYKPVKMIIDSGALGKKIAEELRNRFQLNLFAAEKTRKLEYIELFNDALRTSKFKVKSDSIIREDWLKLQWDYKNNKKTVSDTFHSDISDSVLYAWRECRNYFQDEVKQIKRLTPTEEQELYEDQLDEEFLRNKNKAWWETF